MEASSISLGVTVRPFQEIIICVFILNPSNSEIILNPCCCPENYSYVPVLDESLFWKSNLRTWWEGAVRNVTSRNCRTEN